MATRLVHVRVVDTSDGSFVERYIAAADIHECYEVTWDVNDKTYVGTKIERLPGMNPQDLTITALVDDFVTAVNALRDDVAGPDGV